MNDKLIAINTVQTLLSQARFNSKVDPKNLTDTRSMCLYIVELTTLIEQNEIDHLEKARIIRSEHRKEIAELMEVIHRKSK